MASPGDRNGGAATLRATRTRHPHPFKETPRDEKNMRGHPHHTSGVRDMIRGPIDLDASKGPTMLRPKCPANTNGRPLALDVPDMASIAEKLTVPPARTWLQLADKVEFLLERYAASPEGQDDGVRRLIARALGDMARLRKRHKENA